MVNNGLQNGAVRDFYWNIQQVMNEFYFIVCFVVHIHFLIQKLYPKKSYKNLQGAKV